MNSTITTSLASRGEPNRDRFVVRTGPLCESDGLQLTLTTSLSLVIQHEGSTWALPVSIKQTGKRTDYLTVPKRAVVACPPLAALLEGRLPASTSKNVEVHRIVAVVGRGADLTLNQERLGVHHIDLNGGNNAASNLRTVSTTTHDRLHREHIDRDTAAYIANLANHPDGSEGLSPDLAEALATDGRAYEGHPPHISLRRDEMGDMNQDNLATESQGAIEYNPHTFTITDISLSFLGDTMIVTAAFPEIRTETDDKGETKVDANGRPITNLIWQPYTATSAGGLFGPGDPLPEDIMPCKPFYLEGQVTGELRFSPKAIESFAAGVAPPDDLAERVMAAIARRVSFTRRSHLYLVAAYMALSYVFPLANRVPFLSLHSEVPGAGKTTLMEVAERLAFNAHRMGVSSLAVTVRLAAGARGTLLLDEQEKLSSREQGGDLVEVLNSRADSGATYRNLGKDGQPRSFELFGPTIIANLSGLANTLRSRAITIEMQPMEDVGARPGGRITSENWLALRDGLLLWAGANWQAIKASHDTDDAMTVGSNRHADLWRLLLAVGRHLGGREMFEALLSEATTSSASSSSDDLADAMALGVAAVIAERVGANRRLEGGAGTFDVSLKYVHGKASEALEPDQQSLLTSARVAAFARSLNLETPRSGKYRGATAVVFRKADATLALLRARFPHLAPHLA